MPKNHDLLIAASTIWVVVTAVLVMFMQAGFAFLEAGLTRMKNAAHIAGKNVLIFGICSLVYWAVGFGLAFGDGGSLVGTAGFFPSVNELVSVGQKPFDWFSEIPGAAGYLFEVVFAGVSLAIVWGAMAERAKLWVYFVVRRLLHDRLLGRLALDLEPARLAVPARDAGLRRLDRRPLPGGARRTRRGAPARAADREVRHRRPRQPDSRAQRAVRRPRDDHPLVRLVRLQPGLDALGRLRRLRLLRVRRADDEPGCGLRRRRRHLGRLGRPQEARHLDDAERRARGARRDHGRVRVRRAVGGDRDRARLRFHRRHRA